MAQVHLKSAGRGVVVLLLITSSGCCGGLFGTNSWQTTSRSMISESYPLGSVNRAHYHAMETDPRGHGLCLQSQRICGRDVRTDSRRQRPSPRSGVHADAPFPVVIEQSENNANPDAFPNPISLRSTSRGWGIPTCSVPLKPTPTIADNSMEGQFDYNMYYMFRHGAGSASAEWALAAAWASVDWWFFGGGFGGSGFGFGT